MPFSALSPQQQQAIDKKIDAAAHHVLRRYTRTAIVGFILLFAGQGYVIQNNANIGKDARARLHSEDINIVQSGKAVAVQGCNRDFDSTERFKQLFVRLRKANKNAYLDKRISYERYVSGDKFYVDSYRRIVLPDCRQAENVLSLNTHRRVVVPAPKHPTTKRK